MTPEKQHSSPAGEQPRRFAMRVAGITTLAALAAAILSVGTRSGVFGLTLTHLTSALIYSVSIAVPSTLALSYVSRLPFCKRRSALIAALLVTVLVTSVAGALLGGLVHVLLGMDTFSRYWYQFWSVIVFCVVITMIFGFGGTLYEIMRGRLHQAAEELHAREMENERALKLLAQAQLLSLESRIHPHFLFNTLNSIAALIPTDPKRAEAMVEKLASLLRFSLNAGRRGLVPLAQELKIVSDYLEIEKARFGARLRFSIDVPPALEQAGVPPLALESLVENSIKHVIAHAPEGGEIRIRASGSNGRIALCVSDSGPGFAIEDIPSGHGLDNLSGRLRLLFGPDASLAVSRPDGYATVEVSMPMAADAG